MKKLLPRLTNSKPLILLYTLVALSALTIVYTAVRVDSITYNQSLNFSNHLRYHKANAFFRQGTDSLTDSVRRYVVTLDTKYMKDYFKEANEERHRDLAIEMVRDLPIDQSLKATLADAMKASKDLMHAEYHAMHLISPKSHRELIHRELGGCPFTPDEEKMSFEQRHDRAEELLWDDAYINRKIKIYEYLAKGLKEASDRAMERHQELRKELLRMLYLSAASLIVLVLSLCGFVFYRRYQHERMIEVQSRKNARMYAQLKEERDKSIKAEKAKSYFFSTVSHDIRTPLNSIIGFSEILQLGIDDPEEQKKALDAIITSGHTLLELINDVLDLSKLESGRMELHPVPTDIADLVGKVTASFEAAACRSSVRLYTEVEKMPFLKLDPQRIRQILFNLIGNAVKFTSKGSITIRAAYADDGAFTLSVADTGRGISEENIGKLMSPYVQLQEHDSTNGTGLGLAICKQLSMQMKGTLSIESTLGKGSTFTLRIPNVQAFSDQESEAYFSKLDTGKAAPRLGEAIAEKSILIVDDQKLNLRILQMMLSRLGIRKVLTAENGRAALETLGRTDVDLVLTDMSMPVMDGAALAREIRKEPRFDEIPVYLITADVEMQSGYGKMGFDGMLIKPITLDKLQGFLAKYTPRRPYTDDAAKA